MSVLNSWQKITRVLGGDYGDGASGSATISSDPNTRATYTGTATQNTGTAGSTAFANGDLVICHQSRGTGAGQWEVNLVVSGGGTTSLTMLKANNYTYGTGAQIIKVPRYTTATVSAHSVTAWNGTTGGVEVILAKENITVSGALSANALGFRGEKTEINNNQNGVQGESSTGAGSRANSANGGGGGGGTFVTEDRKGGGGGAGHAANGEAGETKVASLGGAFGTTTGVADLTTMTFGNAGGQGAYFGEATGISQGGNGGGVIILISKTITNNSSITSTGETGTEAAAARGGAGSGAGGSILVVCKDFTTGTVTATGGPRTGTDSNNGYGGAGSVGRIAVHHSGTVTGTTNPTFTDVTDTTLRDITSGFFAFM